MIISLIAAIAKNRVIGSNGDLPWHLPADLKFFSDTTRNHHVLMGRKNFDSIPDPYRPLKNRVNMIATRNLRFKAHGAVVFTSIEEAIEYAREANESELFIIGGGDIYNQCLDRADRMYLTHVQAEVEGDTYFPEFNPDLWSRSLLLDHPRDNVHNYAFKTYVYTRKR